MKTVLDSSCHTYMLVLGINLFTSSED